MSETIRPFSRELDTVNYESRSHEEAFARLSHAIQERFLGVLTGEVGSGKSALLRRLVRSLDPMKTMPIYLGQAGLKPRDFYAELLQHVGEVPPYGIAKAKRLWQEVVLQRQTQGERGVVVILDEAHEMTEAMLLELRFVMSYHMDSCSLFPVILAGQPELRKLLRLKKYEAITQRVGIQYHLAGMGREETSAYIRHHMNTAGLSRPVFSGSAMTMIYNASQGIPRVVNQICGLALLDAERKQHDAVEETHVGRVLSDLDRQRGTTG